MTEYIQPNVPFFSEVSQDVRSIPKVTKDRTNTQWMISFARPCLHFQFYNAFRHSSEDSDLHNKASIESGINSLTTTSVLTSHKFVSNVFGTVVLIDDTVNK